MKALLLAITIIIITSITLQAQDSTTNAEPKSTFELNINGKKYIVSEDEELKLDTLISNPAISIRLSPYKRFDNKSISFQYPRHLVFEFEQDFGYRSWTLTGNSAVLMLFEIDAQTPLTMITDGAIEKFGKRNCKIEDFEMKLGNKTLKGKKLSVTLAGEKLVQEYVEIDLKDFKSRFICFQDSLEETGNSEEFKNLKKLVNSSITYK